MGDTIPVYSPTKKLCGTMPRLAAEQLPEELLVKSRRGVVVRVNLKPLSCHVRPVLSQAGQTVEVSCAGHQVWRMYGIDGSLI